MPGQGRLGDKANIQADAHGCPGCPHPGTGPAIAGSPDVFVNGRPALRVDDVGIHAVCCGPNMWKAAKGSATVFINGKAAHRMNDQTQHCGGSGQLIEGSSDVIVGDGGGGGGGGGGGSGSGAGGSGSASGSSAATASGSGSANSASASGGSAATASGSGSAAQSGSSSGQSPTAATESAPAGASADAATQKKSEPETTTFSLRLAAESGSTATQQHSYILEAGDGSWSQEKTPQNEGSTERVDFTKVPKNKSLRLSIRLTGSGRSLSVLSDFEAE